MKIDRLLSIIVILLNRERIAARELSKRFEVSVRTIYRDIEAINMAGIPVVSHQGNDGGFSIMENFTLRRHLFTFEDMMGVISALKGINTAIGDPVIDNTIEKFKNMLPSSARISEDASSDDIVINVVPWGCKKNIQPAFSFFYTAVREKRAVRITYRDFNLNESERTVEPLQLVFKGYAWYLYAQCRKRSDFRLFRLSRISNYSLTGERFEKKGEPYAAYDEHRGEGIITEIRFPEKLRDRFEDYFDDGDFSDDGRGMVLLRTKMPDEPWMYKMLLSFEDEVEIVSPESIRKKMAAAAKKIYERYQT